ncbi:MAG TPA: hypothetical protein VG734_17860 [Lacunisphaera sp.]|nr:hypothetical protein [Lacunisphaera sp.]
MKKLSQPTLAWLFAATACFAALKDNITAEGLVVTKAELRRHLAAPDDDRWRPATFGELEAAREAQPNYLVVRFHTAVPGHYYGEAEARIDGAKHGPRLNVVLHFNQGWVEYYIPLDGQAWRTRERKGDRPQLRTGSPLVTVEWNELNTK